MARLRIVVASDDPHFLQMLVPLLKDEFEIVSTVADGNSALDRIRRDNPDVAVLDLNVPAGNSIEVARELAKHEASPPVVICLAEPNAEIVKAAMQAGAIAFVSRARLEEDLALAVQSAHRRRTFVSGENSSKAGGRAKFFKELGKRIKGLREKAGFTQEDMVSFGFSARHWQQIEAGRPITMTTLLRVCEAFRTKPDQLLSGLDRDNHN